MKINEIRAEIIRNNSSTTNIAKKLGIKPQSVSQVISGRRKTKRVQQAIADAINMPASKIWPNE